MPAGLWVLVPLLMLWPFMRHEGWILVDENRLEQGLLRLVNGRRS
jgi:hypothetical protein